MKQQSKKLGVKSFHVSPIMKAALKSAEDAKRYADKQIKGLNERLQSSAAKKLKKHEVHAKIEYRKARGKVKQQKQVKKSRKKIKKDKKKKKKSEESEEESQEKGR